MKKLTRRSLLLASIMSLTATAGCGSDNRSNTASLTATKTSASTPTHTATPNTLEFTFDETYKNDSLQVRLASPTVRTSLFYVPETEIGELDVLATPDIQFLLVDINISTNDGISLKKNSFIIRGGSESYTGWTSYGGFRGTYTASKVGLGAPFGVNGPGGWLGFTLPVQLSQPPEMIMNRNEQKIVWSFPESTFEKLQSPPPRWEIEEPKIPDDAAPESRIPVSMTVHNTGEGDGVFRFALNGVGRQDDKYVARKLNISSNTTRVWEEEIFVKSDIFSIKTPGEDYTIRIGADEGSVNLGEPLRNHR